MGSQASPPTAKPWNWSASADWQQGIDKLEEMAAARGRGVADVICRSGEQESFSPTTARLTECLESSAGIPVSAT